MKYLNFAMTAILGLFVAGVAAAQVTIDTSVATPGAGAVLTDALGNGIGSWQLPGVGAQGPQGKQGPAGGDGATGPQGDSFWVEDATGISNTSPGNVTIGSTYTAYTTLYVRGSFAFQDGGAPFAETMRSISPYSELSINPDLADKNFRVGAHNGAPGRSTHALFVHGTTGRVGIGTETPAAKLHVVGDTITEGSLLAEGDIITEGAFLELSDVRFKDNIETLSSALDKVTRLRGVNFEWRMDTDKDFNEGLQLG